MEYQAVCLKRRACEKGLRNQRKHTPIGETSTTTSTQKRAGIGSIATISKKLLIKNEKSEKYFIGGWNV